MHIETRIPVLQGLTFDHALMWFSELNQRGILFHPDDDPAQIVTISTGMRTFSDVEISQARSIVASLFQELGDVVYEAAYPVFQNSLGLQLDA